MISPPLCSISDSDDTAPTVPSFSPTASPKAAIPAVSRAPFSAAPPVGRSNSADDRDAEPEHDTAANDDIEEDSGNIATEQELSQLARKQGVVSGKLYRRSVVITKMPTIETPPEKEGYLMKKSPAMFAGWQKRYFLTNSNGDIEYYKSVSFCGCLRNSSLPYSDSLF